MFPVFSYDYHLITYIFTIIVLIFSHLLSATNLSDSLKNLDNDEFTGGTWHGFKRFLDAGKGCYLDGMAELKRYFHRFGYLLPLSPENATFTDFFDEELESALISYQKNLGLSETGRLDSDTMKVILSPRCGVGDTIADGEGLKASRRFAYFNGKPRWVRPPPVTLTYAFSPKNKIDYLNSSDVKSAFRRAFWRWSAVTPVRFEEVKNYSAADVKIGFFSGDHGDGESFDGTLGVLAHAFSPKNGRLHLDKAERWAVDFEAEKSKVAIDLESVATHEIGHVLGLAHSSVKEAIMYPSMSPRRKKVELRKDDVEGIQALYGSNPNYKFKSRIESDISGSLTLKMDIGFTITFGLAILLPIFLSA